MLTIPNIAHYARLALPHGIMPALAFGLKPAKPGPGISKTPVKRKAPFVDQQDEAQDDSDNDQGAFGALQKPKPKSRASGITPPVERPRKSPKLSDGNDATKYTNLSALRSAKLQDENAAKLDASVYEYDAVYDQFAADKQKKSNATSNGEPTVAKYMSNLLASADVRKRDQLRAKEKALQREREAEGDEFADKDKFVTGAYKKQQEENRRLEQEERQREEAEEERRRKGGGMTGFHKDLLKKDEERQRTLEEAAKEAQQRKDQDGGGEEGNADEKTEQKLAAELNEQGAHVVVNDDGEIVDKRQLLSAGLNVAPKKPGVDQVEKKASAQKAQEWQRSAKQQDARLSQRERQSRMMERQLEEITAKQNESELAERKEVEEKNKSKLTENDKLSAKERYLQRKKERDEEAQRAKSGAG